MSSPRVVQFASWRIRELSSNLPLYNKHIVQISSMYEFCAVSQSQTTNESCFLYKSKTDEDLKRDIEKLAVRTIQKTFSTTKLD